MSGAPDNVMESPDLFPQRLDLVARRVLFLQMSERRFQEAAFLDDRVLGSDIKGSWVALESLLERAPLRTGTAPHWIFHIGHCGSTLLSRLLPAVAPLLPIREPPALRTLAETERDLGGSLSRISPAAWQELFDLLLALWSRTYRTGQSALIKATSDCGNLIQAALAADAGSRAVLMYQPLENYLAAMLVDGAPRPDIEGHAVTRLVDLHRFLDDPDSLRLHELSPLQRVVVSWLSGVANFHYATSGIEGRLKTLDFDAFLEDAGGGLEGVTRFLGLSAEPDRISSVLQGPVMHTYAKAPDYPFTPASRAAQLAENHARSAGEITEGLRWAAALVENHDRLQPVIAAFPMRKPAPSPAG